MDQCLSEKVSANAQSLPQWGGPDIKDEDPPRLWMSVEKRVRKFVERDLFRAPVTHTEVSSVFGLGCWAYMEGKLVDKDGVPRNVQVIV